MASKISISLDTCKENYLVAKCKQNDDLKLEAFIYENGLPLDLTNKEISIQALKADGTYVIQNTGITKLDKKFEADLVKDFTRVSGTTKIEIVLNESGKQNTTFSFSLEVIGSVIKGAVQSSDAITALEEVQAAVTEIGRINEETQTLVNNAGAASKEDFNKINASLEHIEKQKANDVEVRKKNVPIAEIDLTDTLKAQISGEAPINPVLKDRVLTPIKHTFFTYGKNLFNKETVLSGYYVNDVGGELSANSSYSASDYIYIRGVSKLTFSTGYRIAFYDENKNFISGTNLNSNVPITYTVPVGAFYLRASVLNTVINVYQVEIGEQLTVYENYKEYIPRKYLEKYPFDVNDIPEKSIIESKLSFVEFSKNLFDKAKAIKGYYIQYTTGILISNASYYVSDYIKVEPSTTYTRNYSHQMAFYDINRNYISGINTTSDLGVSTFTTPQNAVYCRITISIAMLDSFQLEKGNNATSYEKYGISIPLMIDKGSNSNDNIELLLPSEICIAIGTEIEIYNKQICNCGNIDNFHFEYVCSIGKTLKRKWNCKPTIVGNYQMKVNVYNNNLEVVTSAITTIKVVDKATSTAKNILLIGDSLTNSKPWQSELKRMLDVKFGSGVFNFIGTRGVSPLKHEGRSGWNSALYVANSNDTYGGNIIINVTGVTTIPQSKKTYKLKDNQGEHIWEVEECNIVNGSGTISMNRLSPGSYTISQSQTIIETSSSQTGDASVNMISWAWQPGNPFWNTATNELDFNNYLTVNSLSKPDIVQIFLGANELDNPETSMNNFKTIVDKIISQWTGTKIMLVMTPFWADQNGLGENYGNTRIAVKQHKLVFDFVKALKEKFANYNSLISFVPIAQTFDSEYNFIQAEKPVNPRSTIVENIQTGGVHPDNYLQISDVIYGCVINLI